MSESWAARLRQKLLQAEAEEEARLTPEQRQQRKIEQERARQAAIQQAMLEPDLVTLCHACDGVAYMARLGCPNRDCPDQPFAVNVSYRYANYQGQLLRHGKDWMPLSMRPLTEWT